MTKEELEQRFNELLEINPLELTVKGMFYLALESGAIDITNEPDNYRLPKIILHAILCEMADQYKPLDAGNRKDAENLKLFI